MTLGRDEQIGLGLAALAVAWMLSGRRTAAPSEPLPTLDGTTPPEPLASEPHDVWELSPGALRAIETTPALPYVGGGPWDRAHCATRQTPHALALAARIRHTFPWVRNIGGLHCSPLLTDHGPEMSIHSVGRALDVSTPLPYGSRQGEQLANWAVANADELKLQLVIWNRRVWQGSLPRARRFAPYTAGTNVTTEHRDHAHIEVRA